jgi:DNA-binding GntR family transcriptional regulator
MWMSDDLPMPGPATLDDLPAAPRRGERLRTVAQQIADHVAVAIVNGEYRGGERIRETELASLYGASRAPVREAIRELAQRGLVNFLPRRGAYVVDLSLDAIADVFNMRAALMGLAVRMIALRRNRAELDEVRRRVDALDEVVDDDDPVRFARYIGRIGAALTDVCGSDTMAELLRRQVRHSVWGLIWREKPLDFESPERRREAAAQWRELLRTIEAGQDSKAEKLQRRIHFASRDNALKAIGRQRSETCSADRRLLD